MEEQKAEEKAKEEEDAEEEKEAKSRLCVWENLVCHECGECVTSS